MGRPLGKIVADLHLHLESLHAPAKKKFGPENSRKKKKPEETSSPFVLFGSWCKFDCLLVSVGVRTIFLFLLCLGEWPENQILIPDWTYFHCPEAIRITQPPKNQFHPRQTAMDEAKNEPEASGDSSLPSSPFRPLRRCTGVSSSYRKRKRPEHHSIDSNDEEPLEITTTTTTAQDHRRRSYVSRRRFSINQQKPPPPEAKEEEGLQDKERKRGEETQVTRLVDEGTTEPSSSMPLDPSKKETEQHNNDKEKGQEEEEEKEEEEEEEEEEVVVIVASPSSPSSAAPKCGICFESIVEQGVLDSCRHGYCFSCIHRWSKVTNSCPMCKADFFTISPRQVVDEALPAEQGEGDQGATAAGRKRRRTGRSRRRVVRVQPKKQQYRYSPSELEEIVRAADIAGDIHGHHHHHHHGHGHGLGLGFGSLLDRILFGALVINNGGGGDRSDTLEVAPHTDEGNENSGEGELEEAAGTVPPHAGDRIGTRKSSHHHQHFRQHWGETEPDRRHGGARERIMNVLESRARMHAGSRLASYMQMDPVSAQWGALSAQHQHPMPGLDSLKDMFGDTMDEELLEAVLQQVGGRVERAVEAVLLMQSEGHTTSSENATSSSSDGSSTTTTSSSSSDSWTSLHSFPDASSARAPASAVPPGRHPCSPYQPRATTAWSASSSSQPIILVPDEDVELIERKATPLQCTSSEPMISPASSPSAAPPTPMPVAGPPPSHPHARRPHFIGRRYCPPRPKAELSPSRRSLELSHEEMEIAWRDFAEIRQETRKKEQRTKEDESGSSVKPRPELGNTPGPKRRR